MIALRLLLVVFNVAVVTFLVYRMLIIAKLPMVKLKKAIIMTGGTMLLLAPCGMFLGIFAPTPQYFLLSSCHLFVPLSYEATVMDRCHRVSVLRRVH